MGITMVWDDVAKRWNNVGSTMPSIPAQPNRGGISLERQMHLQNPQAFPRQDFVPDWNPVETKTPSEALAVIERIDAVDPEYGAQLYERFNQLMDTPGNHLYNPYASPTNNNVVKELSKLGIDASNITPDWLKEYEAPMMENLQVGIDGTPIKGKTKESKASYYLYKLTQDEIPTQQVEGAWNAAKEEIKYWANRTDLNLSDEEILAKVNIKENYPVLAQIDESRQTGSIFELNRPVEYSQDSLLGAVWAARNETTGSAMSDAVQYRLGNGNAYKDDPVIRAHRDPTSDKFNPYLNGSTLDEETAFFGVSSFDKAWIDKNAGAIRASGDETANRYLDNVWKAFDFTEKAKSGLDALVEDKKISKGVERLMRIDKLSVDDALEAYLDENYPELGKIGRSLKYKSPEPTTSFIGFDYYALKKKVALEAPIFGATRKLASKLDVDERTKLLDEVSEQQKADVVAQNGDALEGNVPETKVDSGLTWYGQLFKNFSTFLMGTDGSGGGGNAPDAGGGRPSFEQTEDDTEIYSVTEGRGGKFGTSFEEIEDNTETYEQPEDGIDAKRARLDELNTKLQDPAFKNVSPMNTDAYREYTNAKAEAETLTNEIKQYDESVATFGNKLKRAAELQRFNEYEVPEGYVSYNDTEINKNKKARDEGTAYLGTLSESERKIPANILRGTGGLPFDLTLSEMTSDEVERFNWIHDNVSKAEADKYIEALTPDLNIRHRERMNKTATEMSAQVPAIATAALMTAQIPQAAIGALSAVNALFGVEMKPNDPFLDVVSVPAAIQQDLTKNMSEAGKFAFNAAVAVGQQGVRFTLGGTPGSFVMAGSVFAGTTDDVLGRNGSQGEAFLLAGISASFEFILNKADFGRFIKLKNAFKPGAKDIIKGVIVGALIKNGGTEFLEEGFQYVIDGVADMYLLKEKSAWWQKFEYYKAENGGDEVKAWNSAAADIGKELGNEALMGYITGAFLGNVAVVINHYNGNQNAKAMTETVKTADTQEGAITLVAQGVKANLDENTAKVYESKALDTLGIDTSIVDSIKQPLGLKKSQGLFDVLRKLNDPKTKAERVFGALIKTADPVGVAKLNLLANALGSENAVADNLVNQNLLKATNELANRKAEQLQTELDKMPAEGAEAEPTVDFTHTLQRWGAKGLIYINNLIQNGQKELAVKLQSLPSFAKSVIVAEAQMENLSVDKGAVEAQAEALKADTPDVIQNGEIRAEEQAVEVQVNEVMSAQDFTAQDTAIADAQERLAQVQQEREVAEQAEADAVVQTEQLVEQANQNPADEQAIALAVSALDDLEKLRKDKVKAIKAEETAKYEVNKAKMARFEAEDKVRTVTEVKVRDELLKAKQAIADRQKQAKVQEQKQAEQDKQTPVEQFEETPEAIADAIIQEQFPDATPEDRQKIIDRLSNQKQAKAPVFSEESKDFVKKAEKKFGVKFVSDNTLKGAEEAYYDPSDNSIHLNPNASQGDALIGIAIHELGHSAQKSGWYKSLSDAVISIVYKGDEGKLERDIQAKIDRYARDGKTLTPDMALQEIVSQGLRSDVFNTEESINRLLDMDVTLGQKILETLNRIIASIKDAFGGTNTADLLKARDLLEKALTDRAQSSEEGVQYSLVTDEDTLSFLNNQETVTVYRAMQIINGKLYPPMSAKVKPLGGGKKVLQTPSSIGEWERSVERPDLIEKGNKYPLDKANKSSDILARYNPYFHTSLSPLNDQFTSASTRPNLVVVEGDIPKSELTSGYRAEYAKDPVGETVWHTGPVATELKGEKARKVYLSRWFKPVRVVPDAEVATMVKETLSGEDVAIPQNVVTPSLFDELKKQGVRVTDRGEGANKQFSLAEATLDETYLSAVEKGDTAEQQRLVDEAAKDWAKDATLLRGYHGTGATAEEFGNYIDDVLYITDEKENALTYGENINDFYVKSNNPLILDAEGLYWNGLTKSKDIREWIENEKGFSVEKAESLGVDDTISTTRFIQSVADQYDVVVIKNVIDSASLKKFNKPATIAMVFSEAQVKKADPVTYDNSGKPVPLSQRFNPNTNDIRYSLSDDEIDAAIARYGAMKRGENAVNENQIPKQVSDNQKVSQFARTESESGVFNTEQDKAFRDDVVNGRYSYDPVSDQSVLDKAEDVFKRNGLDGLQQAWTDAVGNDKIPNKAQVAIGERLLQESAKSGNVDNTLKISAELAEVLTRAGQTVQAARLLKKMTNAGQLYYLQRAINKLNADIKGDPIVLNPDLVQGLMNAKTEKERNDAVDKLSKDAGKQIPPTWKSRFTAWRYFAMLGNPRTHIRNIIGNMAFMPAIKMKNVLGSIIEKMAGTKERTKSIVLNRDLLVDARADAEANKGILTWGGKYNPSDTITENAPSFGKSLVGRGVESLARTNMNALEAEDWIFLKKHYANALAGYLQANKLTFETADEKTLTKARQYAVDEAKKATYRDASALANQLNQISKKGGVWGVIVEGVLPFKKTPANIIKRGIEYSPIGLLDTLTRGTKQLKSGKINATQFIDKLASGMTGTMIAGLGAFLGSIGAIKIGFKDDKEDEFKRLTGSQEFAIEAFGYSITLDWLVPSAMPLFVGATLQEMMTEEELSLENSLTALSQIMEPVFNLSMLEGVNRAIEAASWGETNAITEIMINSGTNLAGQFVPTLFGQVARTIDPVRRKVYADKNSPLPNSIQRMLNTAANKIPWLNQNSEPYLDVWGREDRTDSPWLRAFENFLSPAYINELTPDAVTEMLQEVYKQTGDPSVLPGTASKYFSINGERIDLNGKEYTQFSKTRGETMYSTMKSLLNNDAFQNMETRLKAKTLAKAIDYSNQLGKKGINENYAADTWVLNAQKSGDAPNAILDEILGSENNAKRQSYQQEAVKAITSGDADSLEATYGALYEWYENEYPDDTEKQLTGKVRTYLSDKTKAAYLTAYANGDDDTMELIEDTLSWVDIEYDYDDWKDKAD